MLLYRRLGLVMLEAGPPSGTLDGASTTIQALVAKAVVGLVVGVEVECLANSSFHNAAAGTVTAVPLVINNRNSVCDACCGVILIVGVQNEIWDFTIVSAYSSMPCIIEPFQALFGQHNRNY
jgi:hypothetical protein